MSEQEQAIRQLAMAVEAMGEILEGLLNDEGNWPLADRARDATTKAKAVNWVFFR